MKVIKITKYYLNYRKTDSMLSKGQFVYGFAHDSELRFDIVLSPRGVKFRDKLCAGENVRDEADEKDWVLIQGEDEWEVIPEENWPEEVCVALAKRALLGEIPDEESES